MRDSDFKTIGGFVSATDAVTEDIIDFVKKEEVTDILHTGDVFDKGYRSIHASYSHENQLRYLSELVEGRFYLTLGNHFFIERDSNPEIYMIQPHEKYKPKEKIWSRDPIIQVVDKVMIGCVQFSFLHFDKENKDYISRRYPDAKHHVGVYHDDILVPPSVRKKLGIFYNTTSEYLRMVFGNIDTAFMGHIHTPIGVETIVVDGKQIPMIMPGSLAITKSDELHLAVKLPLWTITDTAWQLEFVEFKLHAEKLKFYDKKQNIIPEGLVVPPSMQDTSEVMQTNLGIHLSVNEYLRDLGCNEVDLEYVKRSAEGTLDFKSAITLAYKRGATI